MFYNMALTFANGSDSDNNMVNPVGYLQSNGFGDVHGFDAEMFLQGNKEFEFDETLWGSQFNRHIQVLHSDKDHVVLYQCMESANYLNPKTNEEMEPY